MSNSLQDEIHFFPKYSILVSGFVRTTAKELSISVPKFMAFLVLWFYGTTIDIIKTSHGVPTLLFIPMRVINSYEIHFRKIKFRHCLTMGLTDNTKKVHFTGLVFRNQSHSFFLDNKLLNTFNVPIKINHSLKTLINFNGKNKISYEFGEGVFKNQFMYRHHVCRLHSKKQETLFKSHPDTKVDREESKDRKEYFVIQLFSCNDSISITNITKN